jgi:hypothetical protein
VEAAVDGVDLRRRRDSGVNLGQIEAEDDKVDEADGHSPSNHVDFLQNRGQFFSVAYYIFVATY